MDTKEKVRKQYKKPKLSQVKLEVEEAVLAGCKATAGGGKNAVPCRIGTTPAFCQNVLAS